MQATEARNKIQLVAGQGQSRFNKKITPSSKNNRGKEKVRENGAAINANKTPPGKRQIANEARNKTFVTT